MDTATASEDTVSSEDIGASEDTISSETVISDDSILAAEDMGIDEYVSMVEDMQIHYFDFNVGKEGKAEHTGCLEDLLKAAGLYKDDLKAIYVDGMPGEDASRLILLYLNVAMDSGIALKYEWVRYTERDWENHYAYGRMWEWKDTPSYPEETDEPDGWVYSKYPITKSQKMNYDYAIRLSIAYNIAIDKSTIKFVPEQYVRLIDIPDSNVLSFYADGRAYQVVYDEEYDEYQSHYITDPHVFDNLRQQNILTVFPR